MIILFLNVNMEMGWDTFLSKFRRPGLSRASSMINIRREEPTMNKVKKNRHTKSVSIFQTDDCQVPNNISYNEKFLIYDLNYNVQNFNIWQEDQLIILVSISGDNYANEKLLSLNEEYKYNCSIQCRGNGTILLAFQ